MHSPSVAGTSVPVEVLPVRSRLRPAEVAAELGIEPSYRSSMGLVVPRSRGGDLHVFDFGAVVRVGGPPLDSDQLAVLQRAIGQAVDWSRAESFQLVIDPDAAAERPRIGFDRVVIRQPEPRLVHITTLLLAQSAAIEAYENLADEMLAEAISISRLLADRKVPRSGPLISRVGRLSTARLELVHDFHLVDRPEEAWEDPVVDRLFDGLFENLELRQRHEGVLHKLSAVEQATSTALDVWQGRRSHLLEWMIVWLIVVDIVIGLIEHAMGLH